MRNIITLSAVVALTATTAMANPKWSGDTGNLHSDGCQFSNQTNGVMSLNGTTWTTSSAASIKVKSRNINNIKVESSPVLDGTSFAVSTNYSGSEINSTKNGATLNVNGATMTAGNINGNGVTTSTITIQGTATMSQADVDALANNTSYSITHTVTCLQ